LVDVKITHIPGGNARKQFIAKFDSPIQGTLSGFDRVVFRGSLRRLTHACPYRNRRVRALRPFADDYALLEAVNRGEFMINGLRNRDLQRLLWSTGPSPSDLKEKRRRSAAVSRKLRLLVAPGL